MYICVFFRFAEERLKERLESLKQWCVKVQGCHLGVRLDVSETRWESEVSGRRLVLQAGLKVVVLALFDGALFKDFSRPRSRASGVVLKPRSHLRWPLNSASIPGTCCDGFKMPLLLWRSENSETAWLRLWLS